MELGDLSLEDVASGESEGKKVHEGSQGLATV